jgi:hypothetical protein
MRIFARGLATHYQVVDRYEAHRHLALWLPFREQLLFSQCNTPGVAPPAGVLLPFGEPTLRPQRGPTCQPSQNGWAYVQCIHTFSAFDMITFW